VVGMCVSFGTILPGIFESAVFVNHVFRFDRIKIRPQIASVKEQIFLLVMGVVYLLLPLIFPITHICGLIWLGFLLLLEPVNRRLDVPSFMGERAEGRLGQFISFFVGGYLCGFLWEFWNWFAVSRWTYNVPFWPEIKIFEMPLAGFLGFGPFGLQMFAMYYFTCFILTKIKFMKSVPLELSH